MSFREAILLVVGEQSFRVVGLTQPGISQVVEREHRPDGSWRARHWRDFGERDLVGNRIFREAPFDPSDRPVAARPPDEQPIHDGVNIKVALSREQLEERSDTVSK